MFSWRRIWNLHKSIFTSFMLSKGFRKEIALETQFTEDQLRAN